MQGKKRLRFKVESGMSKHTIIVVIAVLASLATLGTGIVLLNQQTDKPALVDSQPITDINIDREARKACDMIDEAAVTAALGPDFTKISEIDGAVDMSIFKESNCVFGNATSTLTVSLQIYENENDARTELVTRRTNQNDYPKEPAATYSEEAFYQAANDRSSMLQYRIGKHIISIDSTGFESTAVARQKVDVVAGLVNPNK
jgi:hypothetical protein